MNTLEATKSDPKAYAYGLIAQDEITPEKLDQLKEQVERIQQPQAHFRLGRGFGDADFIIEPVVENPEQKTVLHELAKTCPGEDYCCNASTMIPSMFAKLQTGRPGRSTWLSTLLMIWRNLIGEVMGHAGTAQENFTRSSLAQALQGFGQGSEGAVYYLLNSVLVPLRSPAEQLWANGVGDVE